MRKFEKIRFLFLDFSNVMAVEWLVFLAEFLPVMFATKIFLRQFGLELFFRWL